MLRLETGVVFLAFDCNWRGHRGFSEQRAQVQSVLLVEIELSGMGSLRRTSLSEVRN